MQDFDANVYSTLTKTSESDIQSRSFLYRKPEALCSSRESLPFYNIDKQIFIDSKKITIEKYIKQAGLKLTLMRPTDEDFFGVLSFLSNRYSKEQALEICTFDLYRFVEYGHGVLLKNERNEVVGTVFEIFYDTAEKTSYTIRLAISEKWSGKNLGYYLMQYSCLLAMEKGAKVKRGIIEYHNLSSLHINLNKVGWICDKFYDYIPGLGSFFGIVLPLDPIHLTHNSIDMKKLTSFFSEYKQGEDYRLIDCRDLSTVSDLYHHTEFKIVGLAPSLEALAEPHFIALSKDILYPHINHTFRESVS